MPDARPPIRIHRTITLRKYDTALYPELIGSPLHTVTREDTKDILEVFHDGKWIPVPVAVTTIDLTHEYTPTGLC